MFGKSRTALGFTPISFQQISKKSKNRSTDMKQSFSPVNWRSNLPLGVFNHIKD
jgi:hypothetical protein